MPVFFLKPPTSLIGPGQPVIYPPQTQRLEYEGELAVVVKSPMRNTPPGEVLKNLLGYTCVNDVTARDIQVIGGNLLHLCHSKSFDTFCPTGPWVETELDAHALDIELRINGEVRQRKTNTSDMIFPVEEMVSYFSHVMTLLPGDLILTGAPPGVGADEGRRQRRGDHPGHRYAAAHGDRRREAVSVLAQFAVNGVVAGSVYALIALGFALIFTASRVFHFAHGGVYTLAAFAGYTALVTFKLGIVAAFLAAIVVAALIGVLINILLYEPMKAGGVSPFVAMISSFGVLIIITHMTAMVWGSNPVVLSRGGQTTVYRLGTIYTTDAQLLIIGFAVMLAVALWVFFRHMRLGIAIRAMGNDSELAEVVGMPARRLRHISFIVGSAPGRHQRDADRAQCRHHRLQHGERHHPDGDGRDDHRRARQCRRGGGRRLRARHDPEHRDLEDRVEVADGAFLRDPDRGAAVPAERACSARKRRAAGPVDDDGILHLHRHADRDLHHADDLAQPAGRLHRTDLDRAGRRSTASAPT